MSLTYISVPECTGAIKIYGKDNLISGADFKNVTIIWSKIGDYP